MRGDPLPLGLPPPSAVAGMDEATRADMAFGLVDVEIRETHRVHEHASSAIISAAS